MSDGPGNLHGTARLAPHLRSAFRILHGKGSILPLDEALDDAVRVEGLAELLARAHAVSVGEDGSVDYHAFAAHLLRKTDP